MKQIFIGMSQWYCNSVGVFILNIMGKKLSFWPYNTFDLFVFCSCCSLYSPSVWTVYLGKLLLNRSSPTEEVARVQRIHLHLYYDDDSHDYDLALLKLDRPASALLAGHARPACLPPPTHQLEPGLLCWVTGWGALQEGGEKGNREWGGFKDVYRIEHQ